MVARTAASIGGVPAHHDHLRLVARGAQSREQLEPVAVGERHVEQENVVAAFGKALFRDTDASGDVHRVALERQRLLERVQNRRLVVDDQTDVRSALATSKACSDNSHLFESGALDGA